MPIWDLVRLIVTARIIMPKSYIRLSAERLYRSDQDQALCFLAGAISIFSGTKLLTTANNDQTDDSNLFAILGLESEKSKSRLQNFNIGSMSGSKKYEPNVSII